MKQHRWERGSQRLSSTKGQAASWVLNIHLMSTEHPSALTGHCGEFDFAIFFPFYIYTYKTKTGRPSNSVSLILLVTDKMGFNHRSVWLQTICSSHYFWECLPLKQVFSFLLLKKKKKNGTQSSLLYLVRSFPNWNILAFPSADSTSINYLPVNIFRKLSSTKILLMVKQQSQDKIQSSFKCTTRSGHCRRVHWATSWHVWQLPWLGAWN